MCFAAVSRRFTPAEGMRKALEVAKEGRHFRLENFSHGISRQRAHTFDGSRDLVRRHARLCPELQLVERQGRRRLKFHGDTDLLAPGVIRHSDHGAFSDGWM